MQFVAIPSLTSGTRTYIGTVTDGGVSGGPYQVSVRVTTTNGKITRVQDNGTEGSINDDSDYAYWLGYGVMESDGMPAKLRGKSLSDVLNMQTVPDDKDHNVDAVSGATVWSDAIRHATIAALRSAPVSKSESTVLAPTLTAQTCVPNASYKYIDIAMNADDDTTIRYTLDGTDPSAASTEAAAALKAAERRLAEMAMLIKDVTTCKELRPLVQEYQRSADKKQFRRKHEGTLILYEAAAKALKEQGFQKPPDLCALKAEYKQLTEQKDQLQRRYAEAKRQMQEYDIIKQNVDGILRTTPGKEQMQER